MSRIRRPDKKLSILVSPSDQYHSVAFNSLYREDDRYYLFFSFAHSYPWNSSGVAFIRLNGSLDPLDKKPIVVLNENNNLKEIVTPIVFRINREYLLFIGYGRPRRIGVLSSKSITGPYNYLKDLLFLRTRDGLLNIDLGPSLIRLENEIILFFSNVDLPYKAYLKRALKKFKMGTIVKSLYYYNIVKDRRKARNLLLPHIGNLRYIGRLHANVVVSNKKIDVHVKNYSFPLKHLNGPSGSLNESLFCPGYLYYKKYHYLFTACSTYSIGYPFKQGICIFKSKGPLFNENDVIGFKILFDPHRDKEIHKAFGFNDFTIDTPSPLVIDDELYIIFSLGSRKSYRWWIVRRKYNIDVLEDEEGWSKYW